MSLAHPVGEGRERTGGQWAVSTSTLYPRKQAWSQSRHSWAVKFPPINPQKLPTPAFLPYPSSPHPATCQLQAQYLKQLTGMTQGSGPVFQSACERVTVSRLSSRAWRLTLNCEQARQDPFLVWGPQLDLVFRCLVRQHYVWIRTFLGRRNRNEILTTLDNSIIFLGLL